MRQSFFEHVFRVLTSAAIIGTILVAAPATHAEPAKPDVETFFSNPAFADAQLSPDGKCVAMLIRIKNERLKLFFMDLADMKLTLTAGFSNVDISAFHWVNNERLVFSTGDSETAAGDVRYYPGLFAINSDGSEMKTLVTSSAQPFFTTGTLIQSSILPGNTFFFEVDRSDKSDNVFVVQTMLSNILDIKAYRLMRLNTKTGRAETFDRPGDSVAWLIDQAGVPRINVTLRDGVSEVFYRDPANEKWRKIANFNVYNEAGFQPVYFDADGRLYVVARNGRDTSALYRYDIDKSAIEPEPLISIKGYDFSGQLVIDHARKKLLGIHYQTDAAATLWFDDGMKKIQKEVDDLLPSTINRLSNGRSGLTKNVLVRAHSDVRPTSYLLYDTTTGKLIMLGSSHPEVDPKLMAKQDMVHYQARDGLDIPAHLTLPQVGAKKKLPMVVLVHGGPYLRGSSWGWDPEVQFLASRGYAVLQPEFRGSTGFGLKHFQAGWKQWGLSMQDDIADGARWAIAQGIADPKRICIAGASYGGYATLMGLARDPDLFRCGIDWVGVTDINLMFESDWSSDLSEEWRNFGMPVLIGDRIKDAVQIKATSPVNIADRIKQPLLLAYGGADRRVPIAHGKEFRDAVRPYNDKMEWVEYLEEGHGWYLVKNRLDFWTRVEKFLQTNIGTP